MRIEFKEIIPNKKEAIYLAELALTATFLGFIVLKTGFTDSLQDFFKIIPGDLGGVEHWKLLAIFVGSFLITHIKNILKD